PLETMPKTADLANASAVSAVSYPAFSAPATIIRAGAAPSLLQAVCHDIPKTDIPKTAEFCRQDGHNCALKPKFSPLATACISTGLHPWPACFERSRTEPRLPDMREVL